MRRLDLIARPGASLRAMTLIEVMVSMGMLAVVSALAYGMVSTTQAASRRLSQRMLAAQEGEQAMLRVVRLVSGAVAPNVLQTTGGPVLNPVTTRDRLVLFTLEPEDGYAPVQSALETTGENPDNSGPVLTQTPLSPDSGDGTVRVRTQPLIAHEVSGYAMRLVFAYADAPAPGAEAQWKESWPAGPMPALIRIGVEARLKAEPEAPPMILWTATSPGRSALAPAGASQ